MSAEWYDWVVVALLAFWFAATIRFHVPLTDNLSLRRKDMFGVVPDWRFFAPTPAKLDFHLLYRDRLADGAITGWTELPIGVPRRWYACVWNPYRRDRKGMFDLTTELAKVIRDDGVPAVFGSISYLTFLTYVSQRPRFPGSSMTQFCVMASDPQNLNEDPQPLVVSEMHWL